MAASTAKKAKPSLRGSANAATLTEANKKSPREGAFFSANLQLAEFGALEHLADDGLPYHAEGVVAHGAVAGVEFVVDFVGAAHVAPVGQHVVDAVDRFVEPGQLGQRFGRFPRNADFAAFQCGLKMPVVLSC